MQINDFRKKFNNLPPDIKKLLASSELSGIIIDINDKYELNPKQGSALGQILWKIFTQQAPLIALTEIIRTQLNLNLEKTKLLTFDICKEIFLPVKNHFPDVEKLIQSLTYKSSDRGVVDLKNLPKD